MATLNTTQRESVGSLTLYIFNLTSTADGETFDSGLPNAFGFWANGQAAETAGEEGINVTEAAGVFTFGLKSTGTIDLFVLAKT